MRLREDSPKASTGSKLLKLNIAKKYSHHRAFSKNTIVLYPYAEKMVSKEDFVWHKGFLNLIAVDRSWNRLSHDKKVPRELKKFKLRRLPLFIASNPINYGKAYMLSTAEAMAAALILLGCIDRAEEIMKNFKWGEQFLELNKKIIGMYSRHENEASLRQIEENVKERIKRGYL